MADYDKATNFTGKDTLTTGDPGKLIKGSELDAEFLAIEGAMDSKANIDSQVFTGTPTLPAGTIATTVADNTDSSTKIATTAFVQSVKTLVMQAVFPVGAIYTSYNVSTDPATVLGFGTWSAIEGKTLVAYQSGDTDFGTAGGTGGSKDAVVVQHNHGITDPGHNHTVTTSSTSTIASGNAIPLNYLYTTRTTSTSTTGITINNEGVSGTGKNLQPYVTVHMWRRTA